MVCTRGFYTGSSWAMPQLLKKWVTAESTLMARCWTFTCSDYYISYRTSPTVTVSTTTTPDKETYGDLSSSFPVMHEKRHTPSNCIEKTEPSTFDSRLKHRLGSKHSDIHQNRFQASVSLYSRTMSKSATVDILFLRHSLGRNTLPFPVPVRMCCDAATLTPLVLLFNRQSPFFAFSLCK